MPGVGCLIAWTYWTQADERMRSAAAMSVGLAAAGLRGGSLDLSGELRTRRKSVERRALKDCGQLGDRGCIRRRCGTRSAAVR